jgi:hypothetical protein
MRLSAPPERDIQSADASPLVAILLMADHSAHGPKIKRWSDIPAHAQTQHARLRLIVVKIGPLAFGSKTIGASGLFSRKVETATAFGAAVRLILRNF